MGAARYDEPGWLTRNVLNPLILKLTRAGIGPLGSRMLRVPGRRSGVPRETPVNVLSLDGARYLVSPRGNTEWVRNVRAAGGGELVLGRTVEPFDAVEVDDEHKPGVLRAYLHRWGFEVAPFFDGVTATSSDEQLRDAGPRHPVFRIEAVTDDSGG